MKDSIFLEIIGTISCVALILIANRLSSIVREKRNKSKTECGSCGGYQFRNCENSDDTMKVALSKLDDEFIDDKLLLVNSKRAKGLEDIFKFDRNKETTL